VKSCPASVLLYSLIAIGTGRRLFRFTLCDVQDVRPTVQRQSAIDASLRVEDCSNVGPIVTVSLTPRCEADVQLRGILFVTDEVVDA